MIDRESQTEAKRRDDAPCSTRPSRARLRSLYSALAPLYDTLVPVVSSTSRAVGLRWLNVSDGERVLDVGTGTGLALPPLCRANASGWTHGVDITPAMIARARQRLSDIPPDRYRLQIGTATSLPYPDNTFNAVYSSYLVDILPEPIRTAALDEMHRVLRPDGRLVLVYLTQPQTMCHRIWTSIARIVPVVLGDARPIDARPTLSRSNFEVREMTTRTQAALASAIVYSTPR